MSKGSESESLQEELVQRVEISRDMSTTLSQLSLGDMVQSIHQATTAAQGRASRSLQNSKDGAPVKQEIRLIIYPQRKACICSCRWLLSCSFNLDASLASLASPLRALIDTKGRATGFH